MRYFIILCMFIVALYGTQINQNNYTIVEKQHTGKTLSLEYNTYKILQFSKRISDIRLSNSKMLSVDFVKNNKKPLTKIKVFAKEMGIVNALITFSDNSVSQINFKITADIRELKMIVSNMAPEAVVSQVDDTIILKGKVKNNKVKNKIVNLVKISYEKVKLINLLESQEPDKMVRLKLYVVEINNDKGKTIKNNWSLGVKNLGDVHNQIVKHDTAAKELYSYEAVSSNYKLGQILDNTSLNITSNMLNSVTLTGGITAMANRMGSLFDVGLTINYLASNGVATVLDETELITLEEKKSVFHAGGKIYIRLQSDDKVSLKEIAYGLQLEFNVNSIINGEYIDLGITTRQDKINWTEQVDGIPGFSNQSINTNVMIKNGASIVLGGLVNQNAAKNSEKIPGLGDIPILGALFKSEDFRAGKSELVFFVTPEIVDPASVEEKNELMKMKTTVTNTMQNKKIIDPIKNETKTLGKELTNEEAHNKRVKDIFGL